MIRQMILGTLTPPTSNRCVDCFGCGGPDRLHLLGSADDKWIHRLMAQTLVHEKILRKNQKTLTLLIQKQGVGCCCYDGLSRRQTVHAWDSELKSLKIHETLILNHTDDCSGCGPMGLYPLVSLEM